MPDPLWISDPVPESDAPIVPATVWKAELINVPSVTVPPPRLSTPVWFTSPPRSSVPPATLSAPPAKAFELPDTSVPPFTKVPPV